VIANTLICLIHQPNFLLDQQLLAMEQNLISEGGYKEQLASARIAERNEPDDPSPKCGDCSKPMSHRTARQGRNEGS
jgi:restriction system protein